jgi:hypothetical protein
MLRIDGWIAGAIDDLDARDAAEHVARCPRCARRLALRREAQARFAAEAPALGALLARPRPGGRARRGLRLPAWLAARARFALPVAAAAIATALLVRPAPPPDAAVREKGTGLGAAAVEAPSVVVHVKRGDRVARWDGRAAIRAGDRLRLEIRRAPGAQIAVEAPAAGGSRPTLLYAGRLPDEETTLLPLSFRVDGPDRAGAPEEVREEVIDVTISRNSPHGQGPVRLRLTLPKETTR